MKQWYTDPTEGNFKVGDHKFSSYYLYDPLSHTQARIKLDMSRETIFEVMHGVYTGFEENGSNLPRLTKERSEWSVSENRLYYIEQPLEIEPLPKSRVYNLRLYLGLNGRIENDAHTGTIVTMEPNLPNNIEEIHLRVIANRSIITTFRNRKNYQNGLTKPKSEPEELVQELLSEVNNTVNSTEKLDCCAYVAKQNKFITKMMSEEKNLQVKSEQRSFESEASELRKKLFSMDGFENDAKFKELFSTFDDCLSKAFDSNTTTELTTNFDKLKSVTKNLRFLYKEESLRKINSGECKIDPEMDMDLTYRFVEMNTELISKSLDLCYKKIQIESALRVDSLILKNMRPMKGMANGTRKYLNSLDNNDAFLESYEQKLEVFAKKTEEIVTFDKLKTNESHR